MAHGTHPDNGAALAVLTVDVFLASKEPKQRFIRSKDDGSVCKGLGDWPFRRVDLHSVERDPNAAGITLRTIHEDCDFTVLPPGGAYEEHLRKNGRLVEPGAPDAMVRPHEMSGVEYWKKQKGIEAQFKGNAPTPVNRGFGAGKHFQSLHKCCNHP
jgi:hypothetical protein